MREVFADTSFLIALLNPQDGLHNRAIEALKGLGQVRMVTSDLVLAEVLNGLAGKGAAIRTKAAEMAE